MDLQQLIDKGDELKGVKYDAPTVEMWENDVKEAIAPYGDPTVKILEKALWFGQVIMSEDHGQRMHVEAIEKAQDLLRELQKRHITDTVADLGTKEPEWRLTNPPHDDRTLLKLVEEIEKAKPLLAEGLFREKELHALYQSANNAYEATVDHDSIQYRKYDRKRRETTAWREVSRSGYVDMDDAQELIEVQQQIIELLNLHDVDVQPTELFIAPRTPFTARTLLRNILSRSELSIDLKDDYLFSANKATFNVELLNILQPYLDSSLNIKVRLLGADQNPPSAVVSDVKAFMTQFPGVEIKGNTSLPGPKDTHDRFIIIDKNEVYKVGASLKDLGLAQSSIDRVDDPANMQKYTSQFETWWADAHDYSNLF